MSLAKNATGNCRWPSCDQTIPLRLWGCREHWQLLPFNLRMQIHSSYDPKSESSQEYLEAESRVKSWCLNYMERNNG